VTLAGTVDQVEPVEPIDMTALMAEANQLEAELYGAG